MPSLASALPAAIEPPPAAPGPAAEQVRLHLAMAWRYLRMHGATRTEADDLAQEAFVIALAKGVLTAPPAATATFLRRTARFLFLRARKAGRREQQLADAVDQLWDRDCAADGGSELVAAVRACVGELRGRARVAIDLAYGTGDDDSASRAAIATRLGMRENGVKTLLQRVRQRLRECIEKRRER
jgi:RNA polymerase sigma factor (sigma-70 family)